MRDQILDRNSKKVVRPLPVFFFLILFSLFFPGPAATLRAQGNGILSITTTPVRGDIYVDAVLVGTHFWSGELKAGSHVVSFGHVDGYITPSLQGVTVTADQTYYFIGVYRRSPSEWKD